MRGNLREWAGVLLSGRNLDEKCQHAEIEALPDAQARDRRRRGMTMGWPRRRVALEAQLLNAIPGADPDHGAAPGTAAPAAIEVRELPPIAGVSVLGPTLRFRGELTADENLLVRGYVEGAITHTQSLTVAADGSMLGDIHARVIIVDGKVNGDLYATESVTIHVTANINGNIFAPHVGIADGAYFHGQIDTQRQDAAKQERVSAEAILN